VGRKNDAAVAVVGARRVNVSGSGAVVIAANDRPPIYTKQLVAMWRAKQHNTT